MKYVSKNKSFFVGENKEADRLLCMLESNSVLSDSFQQRITLMILSIVSNLEQNESWIKDDIEKLKEEMFWMTIFSDSFVYQINSQLLVILQQQKTLNKKEKVKI